MRKNKYIKMFINEDYFEFPDGFLKSKITAHKFNYIKNKINIMHPFLFVCNKTSLYDKALISNTLKGHFVFLKDSVIQKLYEGSLSIDERKQILSSFARLKEALISVVVFPEKNITIYGRTDKVSETVTQFLHETKYNIKFLSLVGTYFAAPIWSKQIRRCETRFHNQFTFKYASRDGLTSEEICEAFNNYMPSSATIYSHKYNPYIYSNSKAEGLESIFYACPNCKSLFSIYSEFNCVKCKNCGTAVECSTNGNFLLSSNITDFDSFAEFQYNVLKNQFFDDKKLMIKYPNIQVLRKLENENKETITVASLEVYCNHFKLNLLDGTETFKIKDVKDTIYHSGNILEIKLNNKKSFMIRGDNKENFLIITDLKRVYDEI